MADRSGQMDIWRTYGGQVWTDGHLADTCFALGPNATLLITDIRNIVH